MTENKKKKHDIDVTWRDILRFAWHYWRPNRRFGFTAAGLLFAAVVMDVFVPIYAGKIVDSMTGAGGAPGAWAALGKYMCLAVSFHVTRTTAIWFWNKFAIRNLHAVVNDGMQKVQRFSADWHANAFAGGTVRKITRGMWSFDMFEDTLVINLFPAFTVMVGMTIMLLFTLPQVGMVMAGVITLYCGITIWMSVALLAPRFRASAAEDTRVGATLADIITTNPTVKAFGTERREEDVFRKVTDVWRGKAIHAWQMNVKADAVRSFLRVFMMGSMVATAIWMWSSGKATPGDITLVMTTFFIVGGYLREIGQQIAHLQRSASDMEDIIVFWLRREGIADAPDAQVLRVGKGRNHGVITFDNVGFKYDAGDRWIYDGLSVEIAGGEKLALVGASGSGKSTFVKLIQRLYDVNAGAIRIDGQDIAKVTLESLRQSIALVPQDPVLFHRSLAANIAYGRPDATMDDIVAAAKQAYAHEFIMNLPHGYDTLVGERGVKLSGGERQRVAIARAILADTPILILDEATSSLDSISEHYIQKALETLMRGRTTITIAHRLSTIRQADRILVFDDGKIIEQGSHDALMSESSRYRELYDMQSLEIVEDAA